MKKTFLRSAAITVAVTGASAAHAVHVNPDGLGQVLLYPYYTVQNGYVTAIHVVNTTDNAKAVKVRFLEGKNSQEVLDFNLYLSPHDVWTGSVVPDATNGGKVVSTDKSCIAPRYLAAAGEPFRNTVFASDPGSSDPNRRAEGYVEVIEMGVLSDPTEIAAVTHVAGTPPGCATIAAHDFAGSVKVSAPSGGLFGSGHLVSVNGGVRESYDPTALDAFFATPNWTTSGSISPSLADVFPATADIIDGNSVVSFSAQTGREIDAVSAVLMQDTIFNEYTIDAGRKSQTDWVVTFPTKRFYVTDPVIGPSPFQNMWVAKDPTTGATVLAACHNVEFQYYNREEQGITPGTGDFSPAPPIPGFALCNEVNTLTLYKTGTDKVAAKLFGAVSTSAALAVDFDYGWMSVAFAQDTTGNAFGSITDGANTTVYGLPVIGFSASRNVNEVDVVVDGLKVYSAVMGGNAHKGSKNIVAPLP